MKSLAFILLILSTSAIADSDSTKSVNPLAISNWNFKAITASHTQYGKSGCLASTTSTNPITPPIENIKWLNQQGDMVMSHDNCYAYINTTDGWITKYNTQTRQPLAKIRVGLKTANTSLSKDDKFLIIGNQQPADLVILNTDDLKVERIIPVKNRKGVMSPVARVRTAGNEHGFIVAPEKFPKIWKISYQNPAPIGFGDGWNHDYRCMKEHVNKSLFPVKRLKIGQLLEDFQIDDSGIFLVGKNKSGKGLIMDLDLSRVIAHPDIPSIEPGLIWKVEKGNQLAVLAKDNKAINIFSNVANPRKWQEIKKIPIDQVTTMAGCSGSKSVWIGTENKGVQVLDKKTLNLSRSISTTDKKPVTLIKCLADGQPLFL